MRKECAEAIRAASSRALSDASLAKIEEGIKTHYRLQARADPEGWRKMTESQREISAAMAAAKEIQANAQLKKYRIGLQARAHDAIENFITDAKKEGQSGLEALSRLMVVFNDDKLGFSKGSFESRERTIAIDQIRGMMDLIHAAGPYAGMIADKAGQKAALWAMYGEDSSAFASSKVAKIAAHGAQQWVKSAESLRQLFNNAGGSIGKLENWLVPQLHAVEKMLKVAPEQWAKFTLARLKKSKYLNDDGTQMSDVDITNKILLPAYETITTNGANKDTGAVRGNSSIANRHGEHRALFFDGAKADWEYRQQFGEGDIFGTMMNHVKTISRDVAAMEILGPNAETALKFLVDREIKRETLANKGSRGDVAQKALLAKGQRVLDYYDTVANKPIPVQNATLENVSGTLKNLWSATLLGGMPFSMIGDTATTALTNQLYNVPAMRVWRNKLASFNPLKSADDKRALDLAAVGAQEYVDAVSKLGQEALGPAWSRNFANFTMRSTGALAIQRARRNAITRNMYGALLDLSRKFKTIDDMPADDRVTMRGHGLTDELLSVWAKAEPDKIQGVELLTPEAIYRIPDSAFKSAAEAKVLRREATLKLLQVSDEARNMAIVTPGAKQRTNQFSRPKTRGTVSSFIGGQIGLFKTFPFALVEKHLFQRGLSNARSPASRAAYTAKYIGFTLLAGAAITQLNEIRKGKDPRNMNPATPEGRLFWLSSMLKGGGLGLYGDFILGNPEYPQAGSAQIGSLFGPTGTFLGSIIDVVRGEGKDKKAKALQAGKMLLPNWWYSKMAFDRLLLDDLQESLSPGYKARVRQRMMQDYKQREYWPKGEPLPDRAPDLSRAWQQ